MPIFLIDSQKSGQNLFPAVGSPGDIASLPMDTHICMTGQKTNGKDKRGAGDV